MFVMLKCGCEVKSEWPSRVVLLEGTAMAQPDGLDLQGKVVVAE